MHCRPLQDVREHPGDHHQAETKARARHACRHSHSTGTREAAPSVLYLLISRLRRSCLQCSTNSPVRALPHAPTLPRSFYSIVRDSLHGVGLFTGCGRTQGRGAAGGAAAPSDDDASTAAAAGHQRLVHIGAGGRATRLGRSSPRLTKPRSAAVEPVAATSAAAAASAAAGGRPLASCIPVHSTMCTARQEHFGSSGTGSQPHDNTGCHHGTAVVSQPNGLNHASGSEAAAGKYRPRYWPHLPCSGLPYGLSGALRAAAHGFRTIVMRRC